MKIIIMTFTKIFKSEGVTHYLNNNKKYFNETKNLIRKENSSAIVFSFGYGFM